MLVIKVLPPDGGLLRGILTVPLIRFPLGGLAQPLRESGTTHGLAFAGLATSGIVEGIVLFIEGPLFVLMFAVKTIAEGMVLFLNALRR